MSEHLPPRTHYSISVVSGLQPISKFLEDRDIQSLQKWLKKMGESLPAITTERHFMDNKPKYVPQELKGRITKNLYKKKDTEPDWKGTLMYKGEIINFGVWNNAGPYGEYSLSKSVTLIGRKMSRLMFHQAIHLTLMSRSDAL
jgi:hypothetical protein